MEISGRSCEHQVRIRCTLNKICIISHRGHIESLSIIGCVFSDSYLYACGNRKPALAVDNVSVMYCFDLVFSAALMNELEVLLVCILVAIFRHPYFLCIGAVSIVHGITGSDIFEHICSVNDSSIS